MFKDNKIHSASETEVSIKTDMYCFSCISSEHGFEIRLGDESSNKMIVIENKDALLEIIDSLKYLGEKHFK